MLIRAVITLAIVAALSIVGFCGWFLFGDTIQERIRRVPFDAAKWQGPTTFANDIRIRMVDDLLRRHDFHAMPRAQLVALIGEPDNTEYITGWDLVCWLGPERGFMAIDSEWLVFQLDSEQKVSDYRIVTD
jgi:hypothetical protein